jgi:tetratricopeptide (TPR) repeat protein
MDGDMSILARLTSLLHRANTGQPLVATVVEALPAAVPDEEKERTARAAFDAGKTAFRAKDYATAADYLRTVVELRHDDADAHNYLGLAYLEQSRVEDAVDCFVMATHFRPTFAEAHYNLALAAQRRGEHREAAAHLERAISCRADYAEAYNALGASALELGNPQQAAAHFEQAVVLKPDYVHAHSNLGYVLIRDFGDYERGTAHIKTALDLNRGDSGVWCNYSMVLLHEGRLAEAISVCDQLLAVNPGLDAARLNRAHANLKLGRFAEAWPDYEARKLTRSNYIPRPYVFPKWRGEPLTGKTVLVYAEQGLGDEIMFASCLPDLIARAGKCVLECTPRLERLLRRSFPGATLHAAEQSDVDISWLAQVGPVDYQVALGSLPGFFRRQWSDFPQHACYLRADSARVEHWRGRLRALGTGPHIGISWRGGMTSTRRLLRSMQLSELRPLVQRKDAVFVSLQYGECRAEIEALLQSAGMRVHHWQEAIDDYDETAALVGALDLVISVQTAVVHLAGALGKPAWVLVSSVPEWRFLKSGDAMPWYSSVRLFRQQQAGQWQPVVTEIAAELARRIGREDSEMNRPAQWKAI